MQSRLSITVLSLTVIGALALSGCSGGGGEGESDTLSILISSNGAAEDAAWETLVADFEKANPDVDVNFESLNTTDYSTVLKTRVLGGAGPDLYKFDGNTASEFIDAGFALDMANEDYFTALTESAQQFPKLDSPVEGAAYSLPIQQAGNGIVYNTALFEAAGITDEPTTYAEFTDVSEKLLASGVVPLAMSAQDNWWPQFIIYYAAAQHVFADDPDFNQQVAAGEATYSENEGWQRTMEIYQELVPYYMPNPLGTDQAAAQSAFLQGNAAMFPAPWIMPEVRATDLEVGYFNFPTTDNPDDDTMWGAPQVSLGVNPDNGNEELAGKFIEFLFSDAQYSKYLDAVSSFPTIDGIKVSGEEPINPIMLEAWEGKTFIGSFTPPGGTVQEAMLPAMQDLLAGKKSVQEVLEAMDAAEQQ
jgi:raffinose/stachyose/melibiose transport system substrate-binding protein